MKWKTLCRPCDTNSLFRLLEADVEGCSADDDGGGPAGAADAAQLDGGGLSGAGCSSVSSEAEEGLEPKAPDEEAACRPFQTLPPRPPRIKPKIDSGAGGGPLPLLVLESPEDDAPRHTPTTDSRANKRSFIIVQGGREWRSGMEIRYESPK